MLASVAAPSISVFCSDTGGRPAGDWRGQCKHGLSRPCLGAGANEIRGGRWVVCYLSLVLYLPPTVWATHT